MVCISYVGEEAYDVILYMGRTLTKLNYQVLIIDLSETKALFKAINHGMGLDSNKDIVNYRDIYYTRRLPPKDELEMMNRVIFVSYGNQYQNDAILPCKELTIVTNTYPHTIEKINLLMSSAKCRADNISLLVRDIITIDDVDRVKGSMEFPFQENKDDYLYLDLLDYENAVNCQVKQIVKFTHASAQMKKYIVMHIHRLFPDIQESRIKKAMITAGRGR